MIDSGTTFLFIKSSIVKELLIEINEKKAIEVIGYGKIK